MNILDLLRHLKDLGVKLFIEDGQLKARDPKGVLTSELSEGIKSNKDEIIRLLSNRNEDLPDSVQSAIALVAKQPGINKILPLLNAAEKISSKSFGVEKKVDVSRNAIGNCIIIDLKKHTEELKNIFLKDLKFDSPQVCGIIDDLVKDILPYIAVGDRKLKLNDCLYYALGGGKGAPFTQIHNDTDWLQFPDADGFQFWFLLENLEETGNMFVVDTPLQGGNDMPQSFDFKGDGSVHREHLTATDGQTPINIIKNVDDCKFTFKYLDMKAGECLLFSKRQLHMSDPRPALEKIFTNRLAVHMRIIIKKSGSESIKFWPNHVYKNRYPLHKYLSEICDKDLNLSVGRFSMMDFGEFKDDI